MAKADCTFVMKISSAASIDMATVIERQRRCLERGSQKDTESAKRRRAGTCGTVQIFVQSLTLSP